ncbi:MAG: hypothetical protein KJO04_08780 [Bacteroidia bacterium]|nr:hypothetical protein [Bacteroidia bacterium]
MPSTTAHSEYLPLDTVFIKPASNSYISTSNIESQWEGLNFLSPPNIEKALEEYSVIEQILSSHSSSIFSFPKDKNLSLDALYCRDASIATDHGMILCRMGKTARKGEPESQKEVYEKNGIPVLGSIKTPGTLEGGDVAWLDEKTLAVGHTYRTNEDGIRQLKELLEPRGIEILVADLPHYKGASDVFHLMSILSPVDKDLAVVYSPLMPIKFRNELLKRGFELVEVPDEEFDSMGCNVLALAPRKCVMVSGNPITKDRLNSAGCTVIEYLGDEISVKGGGGPTCLTRPISRFKK